MSGGGGQSTEPPTQNRPRFLLPRLTVTSGTALVALIAAIVSLGFELWPSLKPDPRTELGAKLSLVAVERDVKYGDWMRRITASDARYQQRLREYLQNGGSHEALGTRGELAYVAVSVRGFKRRGVTLGWAIYDARTQKRTQYASRLEHGTNTRATLDAPRDDFVVEIWLPPVWGSRRYFVRMEARQANGVLLALADSAPFRGLPRPG